MKRLIQLPINKHMKRPKQHYTAFPKIAQLVKMSGPG